MTIGVALFGATGSIGESTLSVIEAYPERFHLEVVSAHSSVNVRWPNWNGTIDIVSYPDLQQVLPIK